MMQTANGLDDRSAGASEAQRLLDEARTAAQAGDDDRAVTLLRRSLDAERFNPVGHYLLGAELAHRGAYGDALIHMTTAVEQDRTLWTARLQVGLLWLSLGNPAAASAQLLPIVEESTDEPLRHFASGLVALCRDDLASAVESLRAGLALHSENPALGSDMQRLLQEATAALEARRSGTSAMAAGTAVSMSHELAISAYAARGTTLS